MVRGGLRRGKMSKKNVFDLLQEAEESAAAKIVLKRTGHKGKRYWRQVDYELAKLKHNWCNQQATTASK